MAQNKKPLLQEGTIRRMMKLANMEALGDGFISEKYAPLSEEDLGEKKQPYSAKKEKAGADKRKGAEQRGAEGTLAKTKGHGRVDYANENLYEAEEDVEDEVEEVDVEAEEEMEVDAPAEEGEVTITDEEAQDIIDLADKLKDAVGGEEEVEAEEEVEEFPGGEEEVEMEAGLEEPGGRMYEEELYEAALRGLDVNLVDDDAERAQAVLQEVKSRIYKRVVSRLLKENKKSSESSKK